MSSTLLVIALSAYSVAAQKCGVATESQPNPIANESYALSGTVNGTVAILPISYTLARSIIPSEYPVLTKQIQQWLPCLPHDQYPAMLQTELDHDVYFDGVSAGSDFMRAGISFPFVDRLNNGYSAFAYNSEILITANATGIAAAFELYGYEVTPATFEPGCNAYAYVESQNSYTQHSEVYLKAFANDSTEPGIEWQMAPVQHSPYSIDFWYNVTNQPFTSNNASVCDNFVRLLNTSVSEPPYAPVPVRGTVKATTPYFAEKRTWEDAYGLKLDEAFYEIDYVACESLKGFSVVEAPSGSGL